MVSEEDKKAIENIKRDINLAKEGEGFETEVLCDAIDLQTLLRLIENSIPKSLVEEAMKRAEKENRPYEEFGKKSRNYWMNIGKISLSEELLKGDK